MRNICKYYLMFPPLARTAIDLSFKSMMGYAGIDYFTSSPEDVILGIDETINKKLFA